MSASRIQKLEALLEQVQERRNDPRSSRSAPTTSTAPTTATPTTAKKPEATPLEAAMQDLGVVAPGKPASSRPPKPTPAARPSVKPVSSPAIPVSAKPQPKPQPRPQPVVQKPKPAQPVRLDPKPPAASGPVASVASEPEVTTPPTFGELLDRTLALRPR